MNTRTSYSNYITKCLFLCFTCLLFSQSALSLEDDRMPATYERFYSTPPKLFGFSLGKMIKREDMRKKLSEMGAKIIREDDRYWYDKYDATGLLPRSTKLSLGYVFKTGRLAIVEYEFSSFMEPGLVKEVGDLIEKKYGYPDVKNGRARLGDINWKWNFQDVQIKLSRSWPSTSVKLSYRIRLPFSLMKYEMNKDDKKTIDVKAERLDELF